MNSLVEIKQVIKKSGSPKRAKSSQWYFKTGKGQYGYGDVFIGITVPEQRKIAKQFSEKLTLGETGKLLQSKIHEERFIALEILVMKFETGNQSLQKQVVDLYLKSTKFINNWDLVDTSAHYILGEYLFKRPRTILFKLAKSASLWEKRIAIISAFYFINKHDYSDSLKIAKILLSDEHDLIHKAVGWMLREIGKRDIKVERKFLDEFASKMPRTTLRYAIERFPEPLRKKYLSIKKIN